MSRACATAPRMRRRGRSATTSTGEHAHGTAVACTGLRLLLLRRLKLCPLLLRHEALLDAPVRPPRAVGPLRPRNNLHTADGAGQGSLPSAVAAAGAAAAPAPWKGGTHVILVVVRQRHALGLRRHVDRIGFFLFGRRRRGGAFVVNHLHTGSWKVLLRPLWNATSRPRACRLWSGESRAPPARRTRQLSIMPVLAPVRERTIEDSMQHPRQEPHGPSQNIIIVDDLLAMMRDAVQVARHRLQFCVCAAAHAAEF